MAALPGLASTAPSGLAAAGTRRLGSIRSSLLPSEALRSIRDSLLVNFGPVKACGGREGGREGGRKGGRKREGGGGRECEREGGEGREGGREVMQRFFQTAASLC